MHPASRILVAAFVLLLPTAILAQPARTPVLVELFTSEGCSSCPPADALLARLLRDQPVPTADILVLEEHVDYWNSLGWHDRFSSHLFTERQSRYVHRLHADDNYTPQMVVDGADQFVGNDSAHALRSIAQSAHTPKLTLTLSPIAVSSGQLSASVSLAPGSTPNAIADSELYAAVVQSIASTQVQHGENGGRTLNHVSVLRSLQRIGSPSNAASTPLNFSLPIPADTSASNLRVLVFLERTGQGPILAAVSSSNPNTPATSVASTHAH